MHTMSNSILLMRNTQHVIDGLTSWINQTGLPDTLAKIALEEIAEKFGLTDTMIAEIWADTE